MSHNQASEMATESTSASGTNILNINFDCLDAIFSSKCLSIEDLRAIAETHLHLKKVVDGVFAKQHKNYRVDLRDIKERGEFRGILRNFGAWISELSIIGIRGHDAEIMSECLDWMIEYCGDSLESLGLSNVGITEGQVIKLKPLFDKLQKISLYACYVCTGKTLLDDCESLVHLKLGGVDFDEPHLALENTFPKLDRFEYWHWADSIDDSIWNDFFSRHKNLKALHLTRSEYGTAHLLPMVADNCKQFADLDIDIEEHEDEVKLQYALSSILTLEYLNKLKIRCEGRNITKFIEGLATLKSLQFLALWYVVGDSELVLALSKLVTLQSLELIRCEGLTNLNALGELEGLTELTIRSIEDFSFDLVAMIKRLIHLKTLHPWVVSFQMDKRIYQRILNVLRERPGSLQQTLEMSCLAAEDFVADSQFEKILRVTKKRSIFD